MKTTKNNFYENSYREKISLLIFAILALGVPDLKLIVCLFYLFVSLVQDSLFRIVMSPLMGSHITNRHFGVHLSSYTVRNSLGRSIGVNQW